MLQKEIARSDAQQIEAYKHQAEYNKAHPEEFTFDNKTGLWKFNVSPELRAQLLKKANAGFVIPYSYLADEEVTRAYLGFSTLS